MKAIMITLMMLVGMTSFSQENKNSINSVQIGDSIIFKSMRSEFNTTSGKTYSFKGTFVVSNVTIYKDGEVLSIEITTDNGVKYDLDSNMILFYEGKGKVELKSK